MLPLLGTHRVEELLQFAGRLQCEPGVREQGFLHVLDFQGDVEGVELTGTGRGERPADEGADPGGAVGGADREGSVADQL